MNKYKVKLYPRAYRDMEEIYEYIARQKMASGAAAEQTDRIYEALSKLKEFPYAHQDRQQGRYAGKGYKQFLIDNYIAIYRIDEENKIVYAVTVQYYGRDF